MLPFLADAFIKYDKNNVWVVDYSDPVSVRVYGFTEGNAVCRLPDGRFRLIPVELISTKE